MGVTYHAGAWCGDPYSLVGAVVSVLWARNNWFEGVVQEYKAPKHLVLYNDGDVRWYVMSTKNFKILSLPERPGQASSSDDSDDAFVGDDDDAAGASSSDDEDDGIGEPEPPVAILRSDADARPPRRDQSGGASASAAARAGASGDVGVGVGSHTPAAVPSVPPIPAFVPYLVNIGSRTARLRTFNSLLACMQAAHRRLAAAVHTRLATSRRGDNSISSNTSAGAGAGGAGAGGGARTASGVEHGMLAFARCTQSPLLPVSEAANTLLDALNVVQVNLRACVDCGVQGTASEPCGVGVGVDSSSQVATDKERQALLKKASLAMKADDVPTAVAVLRTFSQRFPRDSRCAFMLAQCHARLGNKETALYWLTQLASYDLHDRTTPRSDRDATRFIEEDVHLMVLQSDVRFFQILQVMQGDTGVRLPHFASLPPPSAPTSIPSLERQRSGDAGVPDWKEDLCSFLVSLASLPDGVVDNASDAHAHAHAHAHAEASSGGEAPPSRLFSPEASLPALSGTHVSVWESSNVAHPARLRATIGRIRDSATSALVTALPLLCRSPGVLERVLLAALPYRSFVARLAKTLATHSHALQDSVPIMLAGTQGVTLLQALCRDARVGAATAAVVTATPSDSNSNAAASLLLLLQTELLQAASTSRSTSSYRGSSGGAGGASMAPHTTQRRRATVQTALRNYAQVVLTTAYNVCVEHAAASASSSSSSVQPRCLPRQLQASFVGRMVPPLLVTLSGRPTVPESLLPLLRRLLLVLDAAACAGGHGASPGTVTPAPPPSPPASVTATTTTTSTTTTTAAAMGWLRRLARLTACVFNRCLRATFARPQSITAAEAQAQPWLLSPLFMDGVVDAAEDDSQRGAGSAPDAGSGGGSGSGSGSGSGRCNDGDSKMQGADAALDDASAGAGSRAASLLDNTALLDDVVSSLARDVGPGLALVKPRMTPAYRAGLRLVTATLLHAFGLLHAGVTADAPSAAALLKHTPPRVLQVVWSCARAAGDRIVALCKAAKWRRAVLRRARALDVPQHIQADAWGMEGSTMWSAREGAARKAVAEQLQHTNDVLQRELCHALGMDLDTLTRRAEHDVVRYLAAGARGLGSVETAFKGVTRRIAARAGLLVAVCGAGAARGGRPRRVCADAVNFLLGHGPYPHASNVAVKVVKAAVVARQARARRLTAALDSAAEVLEGVRSARLLREVLTGLGVALKARLVSPVSAADAATAAADTDADASVVAGAQLSSRQHVLSTAAGCGPAAARRLRAALARVLGVCSHVLAGTVPCLKQAAAVAASATARYQQCASASASASASVSASPLHSRAARVRLAWSSSPRGAVDNPVSPTVASTAAPADSTSPVAAVAAAAAASSSMAAVAAKPTSRGAHGLVLWRPDPSVPGDEDGVALHVGLAMACLDVCVQEFSVHDAPVLLRSRIVRAVASLCGVTSLAASTSTSPPDAASRLCGRGGLHQHLWEGVSGLPLLQTAAQRALGALASSVFQWSRVCVHPSAGPGSGADDVTTTTRASPTTTDTTMPRISVDTALPRLRHEVCEVVTSLLLPGRPTPFLHACREDSKEPDVELEEKDADLNDGGEGRSMSLRRRINPASTTATAEVAPASASASAGGGGGAAAAAAAAPDIALPHGIAHTLADDSLFYRMVAFLYQHRHTTALGAWLARRTDTRVRLTAALLSCLDETPACTLRVQRLALQVVRVALPATPGAGGHRLGRLPEALLEKLGALMARAGSSTPPRLAPLQPAPSPFPGSPPLVRGGSTDAAGTAGAGAGACAGAGIGGGGGGGSGGVSGAQPPTSPLPGSPVGTGPTSPIVMPGTRGVAASGVDAGASAGAGAAGGGDGRDVHAGVISTRGGIVVASACRGPLSVVVTEAAASTTAGVSAAAAASGVGLERSLFWRVHNTGSVDLVVTLALQAARFSLRAAVGVGRSQDSSSNKNNNSSNSKASSSGKTKSVVDIVVPARRYVCCVLGHEKL